MRATGGKNAYRTLIVQGPSTDVEKTNKLMTQMPTDSASNRMMAESVCWAYSGGECSAIGFSGLIYGEQQRSVP
ncbi:MAG TPA: hypothetical protein PK002_14060 [Cellvibrio sp.]|nr:hypothetical protein [Cellvibrio sp.]